MCDPSYANVPSPRNVDPNPITDRPQYENALVNGHGVIADLLLADGATRSSLSRSDRFRSACMAADVARDVLAADASLIAEPTLLVDAVVRAAVELLVEAGAHARQPVVRQQRRDAVAASGLAWED
jgi:hypothetical protein